VNIFYDWSGGMESTAMLALERERIHAMNAIVRWADTGKQFPEQYESKRQIETILGITIVTVPQRITFEQYLFERGGMLRKGMNDCSRRMKRGNLSRHMKTFEKPYEINLGFNVGETKRADEFTDRNERPWCHWRFPLIEANVTREQTKQICIEAGFTVVVEMYEKMGRFDCYFCPNQRPTQALKVAEHYPELAQEWSEWETRKGHSFLTVPLKILVEQQRPNMLNEPPTKCGCFGGNECVLDDDEDTPE